MGLFLKVQTGQSRSFSVCQLFEHFVIWLQSALNLILLGDVKSRVFLLQCHTTDRVFVVGEKVYEKTRKSQRIASTNVLRVGAFDSVEENVHVSKNICSSGCQFESAFPYGIGKVLAMQILLLTHSIKPIGKVVWDKQISKGQYEIGVEFVLISPDDASSLEEFLSFGQPNMKTG